MPKATTYIKCKYFLISVLFGLLLLVWTILLVYILTDHHTFFFSSKKLTSKDFNIKSYSLSSDEYHQLIPGLIYNVSPLTLNETIEPLKLFRLGDLLDNWNPDDVSPEKWLTSPSHPNKGHGIPRFDYIDPIQRELALRYRDKEIPFVVYNVPPLEKAIEEIFTIDQLLKNFAIARIIIDESETNHFTYYKYTSQQKILYPHYTPPQTPVITTFDQFLLLVQQAEEYDSVIKNQSLYYYTLSAQEGWHLSWIQKAFPFFAPRPSFFIVDPNGFRGINCRFGMKGVIATSHYDGGRNFVGMVRGRKRYILLPPKECKNLSLYPRGHPSARHSTIDWSNMTEVKQHQELYKSEASEISLSSGEILYIPPYWFHYIISQDASIQCNARSGESNIGREYIESCGFYHDSKAIEEEEEIERKDSKNKKHNKNKARQKKGEKKQHGEYIRRHINR